MAKSGLEILVHTTAPSLGREDALYRSLATAYLNFIPQQRINIRDEDSMVNEDGVDVGEETPGRQLRADLLNSQSQEVTGDESHMLSDVSGSSIYAGSPIWSELGKEYFTRSMIPSASASGVDSLEVSFMSVDGLDSPRLRTRDRAITSSTARKELKKGVGRDEQTSKLTASSQADKLVPHLPGRAVDISSNQLELPVPVGSTPSVIRDSFLSQFESSYYSSPTPIRPLSPSLSQSLDSEVRSGGKQTETSGPDLRDQPQHSEGRHPVLGEPREIESPLSPAPTRREEAPSATVTSALRPAEYSSPCVPAPSPLGQYQVQVRTTPPPDSPIRNPYKRGLTSLSLPTPPSKSSRLLNDISHISDTPGSVSSRAGQVIHVQATPAATNPLPAPNAFMPVQKQTKQKRYASRLPSSSSIYPLPAPTSMEVSTTFLTKQLASLATEIGYARYRPASQSREIRKQERGYWSINVPDGEGGWDDRQMEKTWEFLGEYIGRGKAGWGVWCVRDNEHVDEGGRIEKQLGKTKSGAEQWRIYCWGEIVAEVYILLYLASSRRVRVTEACWYDGGGECIVRMTGGSK